MSGKVFKENFVFLGYELWNIKKEKLKREMFLRFIAFFLTETNYFFRGALLHFLNLNLELSMISVNPSDFSINIRLEKPNFD